MTTTQMKTTTRRPMRETRDKGVIREWESKKGEAEKKNLLYVWVVDQARSRLAVRALVPMAYVVPVPNPANGGNVIQVVDGGCPCGGGAQCCFVRMANQQ